MEITGGEQVGRDSTGSSRMRRHSAPIQPLEMWRLEPADPSRPQELFSYDSAPEGSNRQIARTGPEIYSAPLSRSEGLTCNGIFAGARSQCGVPHQRRVVRCGSGHSSPPIIVRFASFDKLTPDNILKRRTANDFDRGDGASRPIVSRQRTGLPQLPEKGTCSVTSLTESVTTAYMRARAPTASPIRSRFPRTNSGRTMESGSPPRRPIPMTPTMSCRAAPSSTLRR
jgi:hypothetical protein